MCGANKTKQSNQVGDNIIQEKNYVYLVRSNDDLLWGERAALRSTIMMSFFYKEILRITGISLHT